jgi:hypothetical protein
MDSSLSFTAPRIGFQAYFFNNIKRIINVMSIQKTNPIPGFINSDPLEDKM